MDIGKNIKAFLGSLPLRWMNGQQKFLAVATFLVKGNTRIKINTASVIDSWLKSLLKIKYNPVFYDRAQQEGWVSPVPDKKGNFTVDAEGLKHLSALRVDPSASNGDIVKKVGSLLIFKKKASHTFDKFLRNILAKAQTTVDIVDSWVDDSIFDTVLDVIPQTIACRLIYANKRGGFDARAKRFSVQYPKFKLKRYKDLHDRFIIVDGVGYIIGPSIKDAASNSPALVVILGSKESRLLADFFSELWKTSK